MGSFGFQIAPLSLYSSRVLIIDPSRESYAHDPTRIEGTSTKVATKITILC